MTQLLSLFEKPFGTPETNPDGGKWMTLKDISARLKRVKIGNGVLGERKVRKLHKALTDICVNSKDGITSIYP